MDIDTNASPAAIGQKAFSDKQPEVPEARLRQAETSVVSPSPKTQQETQEVPAEQIVTVNSRLEQLGIGLTFSVDENTQSSVIKVIDRTTDEVIKQLPSEGALRIMKNIQNYLNTVQQTGFPTKEGLTGILFNEII